MEWTITYLPEQQIVVFKTEGLADGKSSFEMVNIVAKTMAEYKAIRCLIDHTSLHSVSIRPEDIYSRPQEIRRIGIPPELKIAAIVLPSQREHLWFLETVFRNRNIQYSLFNDRESAIQWLIE
jgi:hypothetical protein